MNENRRKILEMLSQGQITPDEAERLIAALEQEPPASSDTRPKAKVKYLRVVVAADEKNDGSTTVNIRVPMQLLRAGVKLTSLIPPEARDRVNVALKNEGVEFDLNQIKPENLEELIDHLEDLTIDVDDKDVKVRVFCE
jgi:SHOCT-like domain